MSRLLIENLSVAVEGKEIVKGVSLTIKSGEIHVLMGPNGSGKSTLAQALMGNPKYKIDGKKRPGRKGKAKIQINGKELLGLKPDQRAKSGLLLAFQAPLAVPGVPVASFLRTAYQNLYPDEGKLSIQKFNQQLEEKAARLGLDRSFLERSLNEGFSGGEKKKVEMLQLLTLKPRFAIFDEIDTGLDIDALRVVAQGIADLVKQGSGVLLITHYQRILHHLEPDFVHLLANGEIIKSGGPELAEKVEQTGYEALLGDG